MERKDSLMHVLLLDYWRKHHKVINLASLQLPLVLKDRQGWRCAFKVAGSDMILWLTWIWGRGEWIHYQ